VDGKAAKKSELAILVKTTDHRHSSNARIWSRDQMQGSGREGRRIL
jgi:hypothetical protein